MVLAMDGLLRDAKRIGDLLPRPASTSRRGDLQQLESLQEAAERSNSAQPLRRIAASGLFGELDGA